MKTWIFRTAAMCAFAFSSDTGSPALPESRGEANSKRRFRYTDQIYWLILGALVIGSFFIYINLLLPRFPPASV